MNSEPDITTFHSNRPGIRKALGDLEAEIMELVWAHSREQGITVRDVFEVLYERRRIAYTTVMNTMSRLAKKKLLRVEKQDQAYVYYPTFTEQEFISHFVGRILEDLFVSFSHATQESVNALQDQQAADYAHRLLDEIAQRHKEEEDKQ